MVIRLEYLPLNEYKQYVRWCHELSNSVLESNVGGGYFSNFVNASYMCGWIKW